MIGQFYVYAYIDRLLNFLSILVKGKIIGQGDVYQKQSKIQKIIKMGVYKRITK